MTDAVTLKRRALRSAQVRRARAVRELAGLVRTLSRSVLFDRQGYEAQRGRRFRSTAEAAYDYVVVGSRLGLAAGPLLVAPVPATTRPPGAGAAAWWASQVREAGFPRTSQHPLVDLRWYEDTIPGSGSWRGGPLAHYTERGRFEGARLGPLDPGTLDLVEAGSAALRGEGGVPGARRDEGALGTGSAGVVAVGSLRDSAGAVRELLEAGVDAVAVVLPADLAGEDLVVACALGQLDERALVVEAVDVASAAARCAVLVVATSRLHVVPGSIGRLVDEVRERDAAVAVPVVLEVDDTVREAGRSREGVALLAGLPWADAVRAGDRQVAGTSAPLVALAPAVVALLRPDQDVRTAVEAAVVQAADSGLPLRLVGAAAAGLVPGTSEAAQPRPPYAEPARGRGLRWAVKSPHPSGPRREAWGDWHFARGLARALEERGHEVAIDPLDSWYRPTARFDDVVLVLRGLHRYQPEAGPVAVLWVISHPELVDVGELDDYDVVAAASHGWARRASGPGREVLPLLQCTDSDLFRPDAAEPGTGHPLLFVGNSRRAARPLVDAAAATRPELRVIGGGWQGRLPDGVLVAEHVDNAQLPRLYRAAGVVLNDHWPAMAADGFLSNRLFDLTAAGARWVSDPAEGLHEVFPTGRVAADATALAQLLDGAPTTLPTEDELLAESERVRSEHSFRARAEALERAVQQVLAARG